MAVDVRSDAPGEVLSGFVPAYIGDGGPPLPAAVPPDPDWFVEEWDPEHDPTPWLHPWSEYLGMDQSGVSFPGLTNVSLVWNGSTSKWALTVRTVWKESPEEIARVIQWLAPYVCPNARPDRRQYLGYVIHEYDEQPTLIWHNGHAFDFDGLDSAWA